MNDLPTINFTNNEKLSHYNIYCINDIGCNANDAFDTIGLFVSSCNDKNKHCKCKA